LRFYQRRAIIANLHCKFCIYKNERPSGVLLLPIYRSEWSEIKRPNAIAASVDNPAPHDAQLALQPKYRAAGFHIPLARRRIRHPLVRAATAKGSPITGSKPNNPKTKQLTEP
jgi:hypothetical protein